MNLLIIVPWLPYPLNTGGNQAVFNAMLAIHKDVNIHIISYDTIGNRERGDGLRKLLPNITIELFTPKRKIRSLDKFELYKKIERNLFSRVVKKTRLATLYNELLNLMFFNSQWSDYLASYIKSNSIDLVQVEFIEMAGIINYLPVNIKKLFVHHELRFVRFSQQYAESNRNSKLWPIIKMNKVIEFGLLNEYDGIVTLSEIDALKLKRHGCSKPVFPSFLIVNDRKIPLNTVTCNNRLTFVGPESHYPNKDGVMWFLEKVWPIILRYNPSMHFDIIGNWSSETKMLFENSYSNVSFLGFVDDLDKVLVGSLMVVPINIGSGIRMKIQEAARIGIPFVTTNIGVEGLPFRDGIDCFIEDEPDLFADKILRLQMDKKLQLDFIKSANKLLKEKYSIENLRIEKLKIYKEILE